MRTHPHFTPSRCFSVSESEQHPFSQPPIAHDQLRTPEQFEKFRKNDGRGREEVSALRRHAGHGHALGYSAFAKADASLDARPSLFASGAGLLVRRDRFLELGGFAEDFFAYYEDLDLGWRIWQATAVFNVSLSTVSRTASTGISTGPETARRRATRWASPPMGLSCSVSRPGGTIRSKTKPCHR